MTINDNVRFWGTINDDETTERLSPRLIDRTGMIFLKPGTDDVPDDVPKEGSHQEPDKSKCIRADRLVKWIKKPKPNTTFPDALRQPLELLRDPNINAYPSQRVWNAVNIYMANAEGILDPIRAADFAFEQRIIPVLRGRGDQFAELMKKLADTLKGERLERSENHLRRVIDRAEYGEIDLFGY